MATSNIARQLSQEEGHLTSGQTSGAGGDYIKIGKMVILNMSLAKTIDSWTILSDAPKPAYNYTMGYIDVSGTKYPVIITTAGTIQVQNNTLRFNTINVTGCYKTV